MIPMNPREAMKKMCPFSFGHPDGTQWCMGEACLSWERRSTYVHKETGQPPPTGQIYLKNDYEWRHIGNGICVRLEIRDK